MKAPPRVRRPSIHLPSWPIPRRAERLVLHGAGLVVLVIYGAVLSRSNVSGDSQWAMAAVFVAAFASSIAGFAFSAICGAILFHLVDDPLRAVQIMMVCSVGGQALMVWSLRREIAWSALLVFVVGAAVGLPLGVCLLLNATAALYTRLIGGLLVLYAGWMIFRRPMVLRQHALLDAAAGFLGGITGGAAAFPGAFVTIWCSFKGWTKERQRGVYQPFILIVQLIGIAVMAVAGQASAAPRSFDFGGIFYLPAMLLGSSCGFACFRWLSDRQFALAVNTLLIVSGLSLLA